MERNPLTALGTVFQVPVFLVDGYKGLGIFTFLLNCQVYICKTLFKTGTSIVTWLKDFLIDSVKWIAKTIKGFDNMIKWSLGASATALFYTIFRFIKPGLNSVSNILTYINTWGPQEINVMWMVFEYILVARVFIYTMSNWCQILLYMTGQLDKCEYYQKSTAKTTEEKKKNLHRAILDSLVELKF